MEYSLLLPSVTTLKYVADPGVVMANVEAQALDYKNKIQYSALQFRSLSSQQWFLHLCIHILRPLSTWIKLNLERLLHLRKYPIDLICCAMFPKVTFLFTILFISILELYKRLPASTRHAVVTLDAFPSPS